MVDSKEPVLKKDRLWGSTSGADEVNVWRLSERKNRYLRRVAEEAQLFFFDMHESMGWKQVQKSLQGLLRMFLDYGEQAKIVCDWWLTGPCVLVIITSLL